MATLSVKHGGVAGLDAAARENRAYRDVRWTLSGTQIVFYCLRSGESVENKHGQAGVQIVSFVSGEGLVSIGGYVREGDAVVVDPGVPYRICNQRSNLEPLKFWAVYTVPIFDEGRVDEHQAGACTGLEHGVGGDTVFSLHPLARRNTAYRRVLHTTEGAQIVLYNLPPRGSLPLEVHDDYFQILHAVNGAGVVSVGDIRDAKVGVGSADTIVIQPGTPHVVENTGATPLQFWSVYTPPLFALDHVDLVQTGSALVGAPFERLPGTIDAKWSPVSESSYNARLLRGGALMLPRSELALMRGLLSTMHLKSEFRVTAQGMAVMRQLYVELLKSDRIRQLPRAIQNVLRVGYYLNQPVRALDPDDFRSEDLEGTYIDLPSLDDLFDTNAAGDRIVCPRNPSGNSCFTDTPIVLMFIATRLYDDALLLANSPPDKYDPTEEMIRLVDDDHWTSDLCLTYEVTPTALHTALLKVVQGLRAHRRDTTRKDRFGDVENDIKRLRDLSAKCRMEPDIATGEQDIVTMYELFVSFNGWQRYFVVPQVLMVERNALEHVPYNIPELREFSIDTKVSALAIKLPPLDEGGAARIELQDIIDGLSEHTSAVYVLSTSWDDMKRLARKGPETAPMVIEVLRDSIDWILKRTLVERDAFRWSGGETAPSITTINTSKLRRIEDPIILIDAMKDLYRNTIDAVRTNWRNRSLLITPIKYDAMRRETEDSTPKLEETSVSRQYLADEPRSGAIVFTAQALTSARLIIPEDRVLHVPFGLPGGHQRRETYQVFGVGIYVSRHYTGYFWREGRMFRYNDQASEPLLEVTTAKDLRLAKDHIEKNGLMFFAEKFWVPPPSVSDEEPAALPQATPVKGITDADDWEVWSQLVGPHGPYETTDDVVADLKRVLPESGSYVEPDDMVIITREDISSVFPAQFMTGFILDRYGSQTATAYKAFYVNTHDVSRILIESATGTGGWDPHEAFSTFANRLLFPINNIKIRGRGNDVSVEPGDHWSLLAFEMRNGGVISARHYDSKHQNNDHAQAVVDVLKTTYRLVPDDIVLENVEACVRQPKSTSPKDPRASACAPIVLGYIRALEEEPNAPHRTAIKDDQEWRKLIIDNLLTSLDSGALHYPGWDRAERGEKHAIFLRLFSTFRRTMDEYYAQW